MTLLKVLGGIDIAGSIAFLMLSFGIEVLSAYVLFCACLLFLKSFFIITGEVVLSSLDFIFALILIFSLFINLPLLLLWIPTFILLAKGVTSFI